MIRKLTKPTVIYRAYRININKHNKKIKKLAKAMELSAMGTLAAMQAGYLVRMPIIDQFVKTAASPKSDILITKLPEGVKMGPMPYVASKTTDVFMDSLFRLNNYVKPLYNYVIHKATQQESLLQKKIILKIMEEDKNLPKNMNKNKMASTILNIANELGADPITIACIIKQETHFNSGLNAKGPKGLMQITNITVKDMYQKGRERLYHDALNDLKKDHPSSAALFSALQKHDSINIKVGAMAYMMRLQQSGGNVKQALKNYNGSRLKERYARDVFSDIQRYTAEYKKLKKSTIKPA